MASAANFADLVHTTSTEVLYHSPGTTAARVVTPDSGTTLQYRDMRDFDAFALAVMNSTLVGNGMTQIEIVAAEDLSGTNVQQVVSKSISPGTPTLGDYAFLEIEAVQIREVAAASGKNLRYVAGRITVANSGDKCAVLYQRRKTRRPQLNLSADVIH